jgi:hypothetical protein
MAFNDNFYGLHSCNFDGTLYNFHLPVLNIRIYYVAQIMLASINVRDLQRASRVTCLEANLIFFSMSINSLFVYFGYLIREGAFQLRGLELDFKTYKFSLCLTFTFTNQCQFPRKNRVRNVKKSVLGQKCQSRLIGSCFGRVGSD